MRNAMTTYWDLTDDQRTALSEDEVSRYCDLHLMCEGVLKPEEPKILPEEPVELETKTFYAIATKGNYGVKDTSSLLFKDSSDAAKVVELLAGRRAGYSNDEHAIPAMDCSIEVVELPTEAERGRAKAELDRLAANKSANEKERSRYREAIKACDKATEGIWENYRDLQRLAARLDEVRSHWERYVEMAKGDETIARDFLAKAFPAEYWECKGGDVNLVEELLGTVLPSPEGSTDA